MMRPGPRSGHRGEPRCARAAQQSHHDGLRLIVSLMRDGDVIGADTIGGGIEESMASLARAFLEVWSIGRKALGSIDYQIDLASRAEIAHESLIAIRFRAADCMIQVSRHDSIADAIAQREHRMQKRDRIRPSRQREKNHRIAPDADSLQATGDRPKQSLLRFGRRHMQTDPCLFWFPFHFRGRG